MSCKLIERVHMVSGFLPVDMQTAANTGDWVDLSEYNRVAIVLFKNAGTAGDDPTLTIQEATTAAGGSAQNLVKIDEVYTKQDTTLTGVGQFTRVTQTAAATYTDATSAEDAAIWWIEIQADELSEGYRYINASVADVGGNAQIGCLFYLLYEPRYAQDIHHSAID